MASYKRLNVTGDEWKGPGIGNVGDVSLVYVTCRTVVKMHCDDWGCRDLFQDHVQCRALVLAVGNKLVVQQEG
jgi:hypothetical protein